MPITPTAEMLRGGADYILGTPAPQNDEKSLAAWLEGLYSVFTETKPVPDIKVDLIRAMTWHFDRTQQEMENTVHLPQMCELVLDAAEGRIAAPSTKPVQPSRAP